MTHVKFNRKPFENSLSGFVDELFTDLPVLFKNEVPGWKGFVPVNINETENGYSIEVVAPGFEKTDFKINLEQNVLTISAEKMNESNKETGKQIRREYNFKSIKRSFTIDEKIDASAIEATYVNGILTLNLPKKEIVKPMTQEINIK